MAHIPNGNSPADEKLGNEVKKLVKQEQQINDKFNVLIDQLGIESLGFELKQLQSIFESNNPLKLFR